MDPEPRRVGLGRLEIEFSGRDLISEAALAELARQAPGPAGCTGRIRFRFGTSVRPAPGAVEMDRFRVGPDVVAVRDRYLPHSLRWDGSSLDVAVRSAPGWWRNPLLGGALRVLDQSYDDAAARLAKRFAYTVFDQAVQLAQIPLGQTWVHSSAVTNGERTALFMAWGGVGKTAALLELLGTGAWRFLSDDLSLLDESGVAHRTPQRVQVFPANVEAQPALRGALLDGRSRADRLHWELRRHLLGARSVRRRVHGGDLFADGRGPAVVSGRVTDAVQLRRTDSARFTLERSTPRGLATIAAAILQVELEPLGLWLAAVQAAGPLPRWPTPEAMARDSASVVEAGLSTSGARCLVLGVPRRCGPQELLRFLEDEVLV
ncbi:MAG: hypothetical protein OJJ54_17630 [Pseudonocardia sp.]|nr:hypothetical protein [Pseudonocardia sp.]